MILYVKGRLTTTYELTPDTHATPSVYAIGTVLTNKPIPSIDEGQIIIGIYRRETQLYD